MAAELADIAGEDVTIAVNIALISSVQGTEKEGRLRDILGKALVAGGAAMWGSSYNVVWNASTPSSENSATNGKHAIHRI